MNVLYVANEPLYPTNSGGRTKAYHLVEALAARHTVGLAYISAKTMSDDHGLACDYIEQIGLDQDFDLSAFSPWYSFKLLFQSLVSGNFPISKHWLGARQTAQLLMLIESHSPEVVVVQSSYLLPAAMLIRRRFPHVHCVLDAHNVESELQLRKANVGNVVMRAVRQRLAENLEQLERHAGDWVEAIGAVSERDVAWFRKYNPQTPVQLVANGVDLNYFKADKPLPKEMVIAFSGSMSYSPNVEGVVWFYSQVWPLIVKTQPQARWLIIGKDPTEEVQALANDPRITVTGTVDDIRSWMDRCRLVVVPLWAGGGTRLKILDAMAMRRVIVSTTIGAEGIVDSPGVIRVDQPLVMAETILKLLLSEDLERLGEQNRQVVEQYYGWGAIGDAFVHLVESVAV